MRSASCCGFLQAVRCAEDVSGAEQRPRAGLPQGSQLQAEKPVHGQEQIEPTVLPLSWTIA